MMEDESSIAWPSHHPRVLLALDSWPLPGLVSVSSNWAAPNPAGPSPRIVPIQLACVWLEGARNPCRLLLLPIEWGGVSFEIF